MPNICYLLFLASFYEICNPFLRVIVYLIKNKFTTKKAKYVSQVNNHYSINSL